MIEIDDLLGVRYKMGGRSKTEGFDCYGIAIEVLKRMGRHLPDMELAKKIDYNFDECEKIILKEVNVKEIPEPQSEGDVIVISKLGGPATHIGVYLGNRQFIHCNSDSVHVDNIVHYKPFIKKVYKWL